MSAVDSAMSGSEDERDLERVRVGRGGIDCVSCCGIGWFIDSAFLMISYMRSTKALRSSLRMKSLWIMTEAMSSGLSASRSNLNVTTLLSCVCI